jgi:hypothetical protein
MTDSCVRIAFHKTVSHATKSNPRDNTCFVNPVFRHAFPSALVPYLPYYGTPGTDFARKSDATAVDVETIVENQIGAAPSPTDAIRMALHI